jgi:uncharacterized RDD family membrane protein YckC
MTDSRPRGIGVSMDFKRHAYDPVANPELFRGVLARRLIAFAIDIVVIMLPVALAAIFIFFLGLVTFLLGWALFWLLYPGTIIWALVYCGSTLGGPASATIGMRIMDLEMRTWYGAPAYFVLGAVHAIVFWITMSVLTPLVLVVGLLNERQRLLHDLLIGTVVINNPCAPRPCAWPPAGLKAAAAPCPMKIRCSGRTMRQCKMPERFMFPAKAKPL